jgi:hypothetical protein
MVHVYVRLGPKLFGITKSAVVSEYDTVPVIKVLPCCTVNDVVVIDFGSIGVLKVAVMIFTAATIFTLVAPLVLLRDSFVAPLAGDVRITVGSIQTFTMPGVSFLQPSIKTTRSDNAIIPAKNMTLINPRVIREKCVHCHEAVVRFVLGVFMDTSRKFLKIE